MNLFESRLAAALGIVRAGDVYLAAVSGGADSTAMLAGLAALRKEKGFVLHCLHVEHGIRPAAESRGDARAVEILCEKLEVPCRVVSVPPGKIAALASNGGPGIEGAARFFRVRALTREARRIKAAKILTAHTKDDLLETLLMRVLQGAGPAGLTPMRRSRGRMLRPLLDLTREDVLAYLEERGLSYRTDSTNADTKYLRNRVRHKLVPLLDEFFPSWRNSIPALAETQSLAAEFIAAEARRLLPWEAAPSPGGGKLRLDEKQFLNAPPILREEAIFAAADMLAGRVSARGKKKRGGIPSVPRRAAVRRAAARETASPGDLGPVRLERRGGFVEIMPAPQNPGERGFCLLIKEAGIYTLKGKVFGAGKNSGLRVRAGISPDGENPPRAAYFYARFPLVLRGPGSGDRVFRTGHARRFSDILAGKSRTGKSRLEYTGIITAEDAEGTAAFIGVSRNGDLLAMPREEAGNAGDFFLIEISPEASSGKQVSPKNRRE